MYVIIFISNETLSSVSELMLYRQPGSPIMAKTNKKRPEKLHQEDDDWIIVKKQRVIILVPAASERSSTENEEVNHIHPMPLVMSGNLQKLPTETPNEIPSSNEQDKAVSLAVQKKIHTVRRAPPPLLPKSPSANPPFVDQRIESENPHQVSSFKPHRLVGVSNTSKTIKQPRTLFAPRRFSNFTTLDRGLRASNLERKLERAGGLNKWLASLGLEQFVRMFQGKIISKYQLVNLTMKKLKDMGANAVGPRRKLIHAMDCVCQPYCFEAL